MFLLAKYNTQTSFTFPMVKAGVRDLAVTADWTPATGDTKISKDGGVVANTTNNPAIASGVVWTLTLTATELSAAVIDIQIVDSATKAVEDQFLKVYTYGNASAKIPLDLSINQTGDSFARIGANGASLTAVPWNAAWDAEVQSEVDDALVARNLQNIFSGSGTSTNSGSTTQLIDTSKTQANDYWKGQILVPTSGANAGIARWITDFDDVSDTFTVFPAWPNTLASSVTYIIVPHYSVWEDRTVEHVVANSTGATFSSMDGNISVLVSRITSTIFSGITSLAQWLGLIAGKQTPNSTALTEIKATGAGSGGYDASTDSLEGFRDSVATAAQVSDAVTAEMRYKKNVSQRITFHMYASGTRTLQAGATVSGQISKDGGAFAGLNGSPAISGIGSGYYTVVLAATDFNADNITLRFTASGCDEQPIHIVTQSA